MTDSNPVYLDDEVCPADCDRDQVSTLDPVTQYAVPSRKRYRDSGKKLSSSRPNQALLWALIDDSQLGREMHDEAKAIVDGWRPTPWKGMVWRANIDRQRVWTGPVHQDLVWNGSSWDNAPKLSSVDSLPVPMGVPSKVSLKVTEALRTRATSAIDSAEVNQAYDAYILDPEAAEDGLWATILAFARTRERQAQCRNLIMRHPEVAIDVDDIFTDFILDLRRRMRTQYTHKGKLDRWIAVIWGRYFFREIKDDIYGYLNSTSFVNNIGLDDPEFAFEDHCVNTMRVSADDDCLDAKRGSGYAGAISGDRILRELDDPNAPMGHLSEAAKLIVRLLAKGFTRSQVAQKAGYSERQVLRLLNSVRIKGQEMLGKNVVPTIQSSADQSHMLPWPSEPVYICDINACAASDDESFNLTDVIRRRGKAWTAEELAELLSLSKKHIYKLAKTQRMPSYRLGGAVRFDPEAVAGWLEDRSVA